MVSFGFDKNGGSGRTAPARLLFVALLGACASAAVAAPAAPAQAPAVQSIAPAAAPDALIVDKLVWSTLAALDQANQTGNYSVLRDLGAPSFQASNSAATLGGTFTAIRNQGIDLGYTLVLSPVLQFPAAIVQGGLLRIRGVFPLRPTAIGFDLLFQNVNGQWRLFGLAVVPLVAQSPQPGPPKR